MIKILHTADWHIGSYNGPTVNGNNARFTDICKCLDELVSEAKKQAPDFIVIAGDIFNQSRTWSERGLRETETAIGYIRQLAEIAPVVVLRGTPNHDGESHFEMLKTAFKGDDDVKIVTEPQVIKISCGLSCGWIQFACLPGFDRGYFRAKNPGLSKEEESLVFSKCIDEMIIGLKAQCDPNYPAFLVTHYTVDGANMESGQAVFFSQFEPCVYVPTLQAADFDMCLLGHIHRPQQLKNCRNAFYCGAVSQLNFNDEWQKRGFYIHYIDEETRAVASDFVELPTREFVTLYLNDGDIRDFNEKGKALILNGFKGKIVRVLYNCTDEHNKAFNKTLLEHQLYDDGAFWVQEITPQKIQITVNKDALSEDDTPEDNLRAYLAEHGADSANAGRIVERATPFIHEALEKSLTLKTTGTFVPVEIAVKNYRNYRDETFSFDGIRFCTINGENGAGKSSLFMDAMCDCLFEETREGDISGWISNAGDAKSGSIKVTFKMGESTYRVTRTRTKSGKATLNLAELVDGEWTDRSHEKMRDTQQEILNTIGMDSLTLKATALIMQDQYGLFLTADKDARMTILGNILGLGIYDDMYSKVSARATDVNRDMRSVQDKISTLMDGASNENVINSEISNAESALADLADEKKAAEERAASMQLAVSMVEDASKRVATNIAQTAEAREKRSAAQTNISAMQSVIYSADTVLDRKDEIEKGVAEYNAALEREKVLLESKAKMEHLIECDDETAIEIERAKLVLAETMAKRKGIIETKLNPAKELLAHEAELAEAHARYIATKGELSLMAKARAEYEAQIEVVSLRQRELDNCDRDYKEERNRLDIHLDILKRKAELLENSGCVDTANAKCKFLADAIEAKNAIPQAIEELSSLEAEYIDTRSAIELALNEAKANLSGDYDPERESELQSVLVSLEPIEKEYNTLAVARTEAKNAEESIAEYDRQIEQQKERIEAIRAEINKIYAEKEDLSEKWSEYTAVVERIKVLSKYLDEERQIPVAEEQKKTALARIEELQKLIADYDKTIADLASECAELTPKTYNGDTLKSQYKKAKADIESVDGHIADTNRKLGELERMKTETAEKRKQASELEKAVQDMATEAADLETLKRAFSQDGIPHNIVRSIIPVLEATATNILGQMSGGKMSVEFVMEKTLKSNSKKEVTTLDVVINDSVTGRLPYLSRSGGERVKSALAVILALAEIKSTKAGVQLGFLFIDEPPFLDDSGIQAYCDALEAIQGRYSNLKVMAITHDKEMKSRFPQSITVYKDDNGSHVRWD